MSQLALLLFLLSAHASCAIVSVTPVTFTIPDPVERYYEVTTFTSQADNVWHNYGDLNKTVTLPNAQYVDISYGISGQVNSGVGHIVARVLVDGAEKREFRAISGNTNYVHVSAFNRVFLSAGTHQITLQYRTPHTINASPPTDWKIGYLKLIY